jgi:hypothetical protein
MPRQCGEGEHRPDRVIAVRAWVVTVDGQDLEVEGDAVAWTPRAVRIWFVDKHGHLDYAWVWVGAVTRR